MQKINYSNKSDDCFDEIGVVSEYEDKGLSLVEKKIYSLYVTKPEARILDVGCFVGRISFPLADKGYKVYGIDISYVAIKRATDLKKNKSIYFNIASAINIPFKNQTFDYVLFPYNTIESLPSQKSRIDAMKEATRTLTTEGLILFSAHNRLYPKYFIGITINEIFKLLLKVLVMSQLSRLLPSGMKKSIKENITTEFGSILWIEPGGSKFVKWHFSSFKEIKEMINLSSLKLIDKIPVMDHGPQKLNSDILKNSWFNLIKVPVYYYICTKCQVSEKYPG